MMSQVLASVYCAHCVQYRLHMEIVQNQNRYKNHGISTMIFKLWIKLRIFGACRQFDLQFLAKKENAET